MKEIGRNVVAVQGDVANLADLDRLYATVKQKNGRVDVVFANAGGAEFAPLGQVTEAHFDKLFNINVKGCSSPCRRRCRSCPDGGSIILNASIVATRASRRSASTARPRPPCARSRARGRPT